MVFNLLTIVFMRKYAESISEFIKYITDVNIKISENDKEIIKTQYIPQIQSWIEQHANNFMPAVFWAQIIVGMTLGYLFVAEETTMMMNNIAAVAQAAVFVVAVIMFKRTMHTGAMIDHINHMLADGVNESLERDDKKDPPNPGE